ncbi:PREDICTED: dnaJ homolog subfamily B member 7 [Chrysochloris asiatica]|uniref:DnaJ homolog subfamily B member 7 n=1 Tax=Chrysochloris asiatica TaxID=185453 RepID=A0A9B0TKC5_CHRAS|nr:PREDICTED: dnaJ homolog subfamily B member 7 [Chrysochloris asiatica]
MVDYYEVLGVHRHASSEDIKKAYHKVALQWHPDKNLENKEEAERRFKEVAAAYEVLSNDEKRDIYDKYGKDGLNDGSRNHFDDPHENGFRFRKPNDVFKEFFSQRDPFSFAYFEDSLKDLINSPKHSYGGRSRGAGSLFSTLSEYPTFESSFFSYDRDYTPDSSLGHEGLTSFSPMAYEDDRMGNYTSVTTPRENCRNLHTKRVIENDQEREEVEDDEELKSFLTNASADGESLAEECSWGRESFSIYSSNSYSPKYVPQYTFKGNEEQGVPWVTSSWDPSIFSAGFKEGGKRKKKKRKEVKKKSTKRKS